MAIPNRGSLNQVDIFKANNAPVASVVLVTGQYNKIGEVICPAGLYKKIGFGASNSQSDAQGRMYAKLATAASAEITGKLRISVFSPQDRSLAVIFEAPSAALNQNATDRTKQIPMPELPFAIGKDFKFVFEFNPDAAGTITAAQSVIQIDTTEQLLN